MTPFGRVLLCPVQKTLDDGILIIIGCGRAKGIGKDTGTIHFALRPVYLIIPFIFSDRIGEVADIPRMINRRQNITDAGQILDFFSIEAAVGIRRTGLVETSLSMLQLGKANTIRAKTVMQKRIKELFCYSIPDHNR